MLKMNSLLERLNVSSRTRCPVLRCLFICFLFMFFNPIGAYATSEMPCGEGTIDRPYRISSRDELEWIASKVNEGESFTNSYFEQTDDIDLGDEEWHSIGGSADGVPFDGVYDGCGHEIENLIIKENNSALFYAVSGSITNLRVGTGEISGDGSAAIAVKSEGPDAVIANCVSSVSISGNGSAGIAVDFPDGTIAVCVYDGKISGSDSYGIIAKVSDVKLYRTYTVSNTWICPTGIVSTNSFVVSVEELRSLVTARKLSLFAALSDYLFFDDSGQRLLEWDISETGALVATRPGYITHVVTLLSEWLLPCVATIVLLHRLMRRRWTSKMQHVHRTDNVSVIGMIVQVGVVVFCDAYCIAHGFKDIKMGPMIFVVLMHVHLGLSLIGLRLKTSVPFNRLDAPLLISLVLMIIVELLQFGNVPRYDANIYYGSFVEGCRTFNLDLLSFIGSFNCWKWAQGVALFCAPFEFLLPGQIISVYLGNLIISAITLLLFNSLLRMVYKDIGNRERAIYCLIFVFSPYIVGLFSYFDMDWNAACYIVWLLYALAKKDDTGVCICGFLLGLTKITGLAFYVLILLFVAAVDIFLKRGYADAWKEHFKIGRLFRWMMPAFMYLILLLYGDDLTSQAFFGTYVATEGIIDIFDVDQFANTLLQSFVFCFRWLLVGLLLASILCVVKKREGLRLIKNEQKMLFLALPIASVLTILVLCIYNSDANCPRYTTILSPLYALMLPFAVRVLFPAKWENRISLALLAALSIQTFVTIDPAIILYCQKADTGSFPLYKLAYREDQRPGMNLVSGPNDSIDMLGDLYTYNLQYSFYDSLLDKALSIIEPDEETIVYALNVGTYEVNLSGKGFGSYNIYYNPSTGRRSFFRDAESVHVDFRDLKLDEDEEISDDYGVGTCKSFWIVAPHRVYRQSIIKSLEETGYFVEYQEKISNVYGSLMLLKVTERNA